MKIDGKSKDLLKENIKQLEQLFPEVCCEDKIDFDKLKQVLGEYVDDDRERYNFTWNGKGRSLRLSQTPSLGTLRPCKEESKDWDSTQNLYIEGDNLEVLKLLQKSYYGKVKMIYIDPPYNTGSDFVYPDDFDDSIEHYKEITGQIDSEGNKQSTNPETNGRFHTDWLNMMYPRLKLARSLMSATGVIFISISDYEVDNLKKVCNEIFGENNFIGQISIITGANQSGEGVLIQKNVEYCLCYAKDIKCVKVYRIDETEQIYRNLNDAPTPLDTRLDMGYTIYYNSSTGEMIPRMDYDKSKVNLNTIEDVYSDDEKLIEAGCIPIRAGFRNGKLHRWRWGIETFEERKKEIKIFESESKYIPKFLQEGFSAAKNIWSFSGGKGDLKKIFDIPPFEYPKGIAMLKYIIAISSIECDIILDFFSGSATTAHAVMRLNAEDGGDRRFIMVQLPEVCGEKTEAYKAGYKNICEIGKERIRRAGEKIKAQIEEENAQLKIDEEPKKVPDIGFRVFKLDSSNLKKWQPDYDDLEKTLLDSIENYVEGRSELDVVYEIILKMGLDLTYPVDELDVNGRKIYSVAFGALMICLDDHITKEIADGMISLYQEYQPELWKVVFKDNGFENDSAKTNIKEQLKAAGLEEDAFTTI